MANRSKEELIFEAIAALRRVQTDQDLFDDLAAERLGVNRTDLRVMDVLHQKGSMTAGTLAEESGLSRPALTAAVDRVAKLGYVRRVRSEADRREVRVALTEKVGEIAMEIWGQTAVEAPSAFSGFTRRELEIVTGFLEQAHAFSERHRERLRKQLRAG